MQINTTIDEELYDKLSKLSQKRGTSIQEIVRSALRLLCPDVQTIKVQKVGGDEIITTEALISEVYLEVGNYWFGTFEIGKNDFKKLGVDGPVFADNRLEFMITTENERQGLARLLGFSSGGWKGVLIKFSGVSSLS